MNTMKKNGGFTLIELIIVIAILAILSTGAIAGYSAYINNANNASVNAILNDISTSAALANAAASPIEKIEVTVSDDTTWSIKVTAKNNKWDEATDGFVKLFGDSLGITNGALSGNPKVYNGTVTLTTKWANSEYASTGATWTPAEGWETTPTTP